MPTGKQVGQQDVPGAVRAGEGQQAYAAPDGGQFATHQRLVTKRTAEPECYIFDVVPNQRLAPAALGAAGQDDPSLYPVHEEGGGEVARRRPWAGDAERLGLPLGQDVGGVKGIHGRYSRTT